VPSLWARASGGLRETILTTTVRTSSSVAVALLLPLLGCRNACAPRAFDTSRAETESTHASDLDAQRPEQVEAPDAVADVADAGLAPLDGDPIVSLDVEGHGAAILVVPIDARDARPLIVATHGNFDRPEWQCEVWSKIVRGATFVLCPRGTRRPDSPGPNDARYTYGGAKVLEREIDGAVAALRRSRYASHLAEGPAVYAGFSLGAILGVTIAERRAADFPSLVLIEGGSGGLRDEVARRFAGHGGLRVLMACAQRGCGAGLAARARRLEGLGLEATTLDVGHVGHTYDGKVADAVERALPGFLQGDERFARALGDAGR
jgi:pimeloyl-ACP methyl ester carboxylesterase